MEPVYLDHNATTPLAPEALQVMVEALESGWGNPSSDHVWGRKARAFLDTARGQVASLVGAEPHEVVFTGGGTEANNLAIRGVAAAAPRGKHVVSSQIEHPATLAPLEQLANEGFAVDLLRPRMGRMHPGEAAMKIRADTTLVTVMLANNETGALQPLPEVARLAHEAGALVHTDAAQAVGKVRVNMDALGVDLLSIAGHKLYGPKGVGALIVRDGTPLRPFVLGAGHERGLRPGTENVAAIAGLGAAAELAESTLAAEQKRLIALRKQMITGLRAIRGMRVTVGGPCLPNTVHVLLPKVLGREVLARCPQIAASTGSACHEGIDHASPVLLAMDLPPEEALGALRLTLGRSTTAEQVDVAVRALVAAYGELRKVGV